MIRKLFEWRDGLAAIIAAFAVYCSDLVIMIFHRHIWQLDLVWVGLLMLWGVLLLRSVFKRRVI